MFAAAVLAEKIVPHADVSYKLILRESKDKLKPGETPAMRRAAELAAASAEKQLGRRISRSSPIFATTDQSAKGRWKRSGNAMLAGARLVKGMHDPGYHQARRLVLADHPSMPAPPCRVSACTTLLDPYPYLTAVSLPEACHEPRSTAQQRPRAIAPHRTTDVAHLPISPPPPRASHPRVHGWCRWRLSTMQKGCR